MCILNNTSDIVSGKSCPLPAQRLQPQQRQDLALAALAGTQTITDLAEQHQVSRKFVYQQVAKAADALDDAFTPTHHSANEKVLFNLPVTETFLRRVVLASLMLCHSSYRGVYELLRDVLHCPRSLGYIHRVAHDAMRRAHLHNTQQDLSSVAIGAHDEIFQKRRPVLVGVDTASHYCYLLSPETQRDGDTWALRLLELQDRGFDPAAAIGDSGSGLRAGLERALPTTQRRSDVFHVLREVRTVAAALEKQAYEALNRCDKLQRRQADYQRKKGRCQASISQRLRYARPEADAAVALADDVATLADWLQHDVLALAAPEHAERQKLYDFIVAQLQTLAPQCPHRIKPLCTYLANERDAVLAFAVQLDAALSALSDEFQVAPAVLRVVLSVQRMDVRDPRRWPREAALRQQLRGRYHEVAKAVMAVAARTVRASSVVENLNSRLRNYFFLRRHLGGDYLHLLQFFLNHHRFLRSDDPKRVDRSPAELLTGERHAPWLALLGLADPLAA